MEIRLEHWWKDCIVNFDSSCLAILVTIKDCSDTMKNELKLENILEEYFWIVNCIDEKCKNIYNYFKQE